jgi:hypothetical protein
MRYTTIITVIVLLFIGGYFSIEKGGHTMAMSKPLETVNKDIPKIDVNVPAATETATFALG